MTDFRDLVGNDLDGEELERLERVDRLLRSVPAPPSEIPDSLDRAVHRIGTQRRIWTSRRIAVAVALAATLATVFFSVGRWTGGSNVDYRTSVPLEATTDAPHASGLIQIAESDRTTGNQELKLQVTGLPKLSGGDYYVLWLAKDGKYAGACGTFNVGSGTTTVDMTVSYRLQDYDAWVISRHEENSPWLLSARIAS
jgi:anti-sigma-K factor RskA